MNLFPKSISKIPFVFVAALGSQFRVQNKLPWKSANAIKFKKMILFLTKRLKGFRGDENYSHL